MRMRGIDFCQGTQPLIFIFAPLVRLGIVFCLFIYIYIYVCSDDKSTHGGEVVPKLRV